MAAARVTLAQLQLPEHAVQKLQPCAQGVDPTLMLNAIRERVECGASEILLNRSEAVVDSKGGRDRRLGSNGGRQSRASQALQAGGDDVRGYGRRARAGGKQSRADVAAGASSGRTRRSAMAGIVQTRVSAGEQLSEKRDWVRGLACCGSTYGCQIRHSVPFECPCKPIPGPYFGVRRVGHR